MEVVVDIGVCHCFRDGLSVDADANQLIHKFLRVFFAEEIPEETEVADEAVADVGDHLHGAAFRPDLFVHRILRRFAVVPLPRLVFFLHELADDSLFLLRKILKCCHLVLLHDEIHQIVLELQNGHGFWQMLGDVGDAAAHGLHRLVDEFVGIHLEGVGQIRHLRGEQQRAVLQHAVPEESHGVAGNLLSVDYQIIASGKGGRNAQRLQCIHNGLQVLQKVDFLLSGLHILDEGEVEVADVVEDRAAAGQPPHYVNMMAVNVFLVDFRRRVLVPADDDGVVVLPQHEDVVGGLLQQVLLHREVVIGGGGGEGNVSELFHFDYDK